MLTWLGVGHTKSKAVMLNRKCTFRPPVILSGGHFVSVKYFGITLESKFTFTCHLRTNSASAVISTRTVDRLMLNVGDPLVSKRRLQTSVVLSQPCMRFHFGPRRPENLPFTGKR